MNEERFEAAKDTHPTLRREVTELANEWTAYCKTNKNIARWQQDHFAPGSYAELIRAFFTVDEAMDYGDRACISVFPVLDTNYSGPLLAPGSKVKSLGSGLPGLMIVTDRYLATVVQILDGWLPLVLPAEHIVSVRRVRVGGMMVVPKLQGLMFELEEDSEKSVMLLTFAQFLGEGDVDGIATEIRSTLSC